MALNYLLKVRAANVAGRRPRELMSPWRWLAVGLMAMFLRGGVLGLLTLRWGWPAQVSILFAVLAGMAVTASGYAQVLSQSEAGERARTAGDSAHRLCLRAALAISRIRRAPSGGGVLLELLTASGLRISGPSADGRVADQAGNGRFRSIAIRRAHRRAGLRRRCLALCVSPDAQSLRRGECLGRLAVGTDAAVLFSLRSAHDPRLPLDRRVGRVALLSRTRAARGPPRGVVVGRTRARSGRDIKILHWAARSRGGGIHALGCQARRWWRSWEPYGAALLAAAIFSPVILWNAEHDWASFAFQTSRRIAEASKFALHKLIASALVLITPTGVLAVAASFAGR